MDNALLFSCGENHTNRQRGNQMATQTLIANMIDKYVEVYARAVTAGCDDLEAHAVTAKFFSDGFKEVA